MALENQTPAEDRIATPTPTEHARAAALDADLEDSDEFGMVVTDAQTGASGATIVGDTAREEAKHLAGRHGFDVEFRDSDGHYPERVSFTSRTPEF